MFLRERATQAEYCDRPDLSPEEVASSHRQLSRFNSLMQVGDPFQRLLVRWLGRESVQRLSLLDLGAGNCSVGHGIEKWAARHGWDWRVTNLDSSVAALALGEGGRRVAGNVCALPFRDESFDVVIASQMTHHLTDQETVSHFREAWRVSRDALFLTDAHRNLGSLCIIWLLLKCLRVTPTFLADGILSVRRGWRLGEWKVLARQAGIPEPRVWLYYGSRIVLQARRPRAFPELQAAHNCTRPASMTVT